MIHLLQYPRVLETPRWMYRTPPAFRQSYPAPGILYTYTRTVLYTHTVEEGCTVYRRDGKGRRCFVRDKIASIPGSASYFTPERFEE